jgi:hypothetical protein
MATGDNAAAAVYFTDTDAGTSNRDQGLNLHRPRDLSKDKKTKRQKDISRYSDESSRPNLLSAPDGKETSSPSPEGLGAQWSEQRDQVAEQLGKEDGQWGSGRTMAAETSSRAYNWISVQHSRTRRGCKLAINLQNSELVQTGEIFELTAELKHPSRTREMRRNEHDDSFFQQATPHLIDHYRQLEGEWYLGRVHDRGARSQWKSNTLVAGLMRDNRIVAVVLHLDEETYSLDMDQEVSFRQQAYYHSSGYWGQLIRRSPQSLHRNTAPRGIA